MNHGLRVSPHWNIGPAVEQEPKWHPLDCDVGEWFFKSAMKTDFKTAAGEILHWIEPPYGWKIWEHGDPILSPLVIREFQSQFARTAGGAVYAIWRRIR